MSQEVRSVVLAGKGLLRWPSGDERVDFRVTVGLDGCIESIHVGPPVPEILHRPSSHGRLYLVMPQGQRIALNVAPNGHLSPDGCLERSVDGQDWWVDPMPWLPFETPHRLTLAMKAGAVAIFESHATEEDAEAAFRAWPNVEMAEIRPLFARPTRLK